MLQVGVEPGLHTALDSLPNQGQSRCQVQGPRARAHQVLYSLVRCFHCICGIRCVALWHTAQAAGPGGTQQGSFRELFKDAKVKMANGC